MEYHAGFTVGGVADGVNLRHFVREMPASMEFLRTILGIIGVACAFMAARAFVLSRKGLEKPWRTTGWLFRTAICVGGMLFRHTIDVLAISIFVLIVVAAGAGWWIHTHRRQEDLTHPIFPDGQ